MAQNKPNWIAVDWGTTHLRAWAMQGATAIADAHSSDGMGTLSQDAFEPALLSLISPWLGSDHMPVVACGMVGARQGWVEAPYQTVPVKPLADHLMPAPCSDARFSVHLIPGLKQAAPPDVMRGEETQIAGFLALNSGWDGVICLPGTHTKWVQVSAGEVISFQTCMTGELFGLLGSRSVLRHSVGAAGWDDAVFDDAVDQTLSHPATLAAKLFQIRARDLVDTPSPEAARAALSGLLIGSELAASRPYWLGQQVALIGANETTRPYARALERQGAFATLADSPRMTLAGLTAAFRNLQEYQ